MAWQWPGRDDGLDHLSPRALGSQRVHTQVGGKFATFGSALGADGLLNGLLHCQLHDTEAPAADAMPTCLVAHIQTNA